MATDKENWEKYIRNNPTNNISIEEKYLINNREVVSAKYLQQIWGVSDRTIRNYIDQKMPFLEEHSTGRFKIFDLLECFTWRMNNIDMAKSNVSNIQQKEAEKSDTEALVSKANRDKIIADAKKATHEANIAEIKEKTAIGELISIEDVDKVTAEQAVLHKTDIINAEKILPTELENLSRGEIAQCLKKFNQDRLDNLDKLIQKDFDCDETLYEIIQEALNMLHKKSPKQIIEKIRS